MKISQFDIIEVEADVDASSEEVYDHVMVTFPCTNEKTKNMWIVDCIPGNIENDKFTPLEGYEVGTPIFTNTFIKKKKDLTALNKLF